MPPDCEHWRSHLSFTRSHPASVAQALSKRTGPNMHTPFTSPVCPLPAWSATRTDWSMKRSAKAAARRMTRSMHGRKTPPRRTGAARAEGSHVRLGIVWIQHGPSGRCALSHSMRQIPRQLERVVTMEGAAWNAGERLAGVSADFAGKRATGYTVTHTPSGGLFRLR
jgi:hypothetical protein